MIFAFHVGGVLVFGHGTVKSPQELQADTVWGQRQRPRDERPLRCERSLTDVKRKAHRPELAVMARSFPSQREPAPALPTPT